VKEGLEKPQLRTARSLQPALLMISYSHHTKESRQRPRPSLPSSRRYHSADQDWHAQPQCQGTRPPAARAMPHKGRWHSHCPRTRPRRKHQQAPARRGYLPDHMSRTSRQRPRVSARSPKDPSLRKSGPNQLIDTWRAADGNGYGRQNPQHSRTSRRQLRRRRSRAGKAY